MKCVCVVSFAMFLAMLIGYVSLFLVLYVCVLSTFMYGGGLVQLKVSL